MANNCKNLPDPPGATFTAYSPDGRYIITAGTNNAVRKYTVASEDEPETIDDCQESNTGLAVSVCCPPGQVLAHNANWGGGPLERQIHHRV